MEIEIVIKKVIEILIPIILIPIVAIIIDLIRKFFINPSKINAKNVFFISLIFVIFIALLTFFLISENMIVITIFLPFILVFSIYLFNMKKINDFLCEKSKNFYEKIILIFNFFKIHKFLLCFILFLLTAFMLIIFLFDLTFVNTNDTNVLKRSIIVKNVIHIIPQKITEIPEYFYKDDKVIKSIVIPDHIKTIKKGAFKNCKNLKKVIIGNNVTVIEDEVFANCEKLETVQFKCNSDDLELGNSVFVGCSSLKKISFPNNLTKTGNNIFNGCNNLITVNLPTNDEFNTIEAYFFGGCENLLNINKNKDGLNVIPKNIKYIGPGAFGGCEKLTNIDLSHVKSIQTGAFAKSGIINADLSNIDTIYPYTFNSCEKLKSVTLINTKFISYCAFCNCTSLKEIKFNDKLNNNFNKIEQICSLAFYNTKITEFEISKSLKKVEECAFFNCSQLNKFTYATKDHKNFNFSIDSYGALLSKDGHELIHMPSNINKYVIGSKIKNIRPSAITCLNKNCHIDVYNNVYTANELGIYKNNILICLFPQENESLVILDENLTEIGPYAFAGNNNVKYIDLTYTNINKISKYAFGDCEILNSIDLPIHLKEIGEGSFSNCKNLLEINIPLNVKRIEDDTFIDCEELNNVVLSPLTKYIGDSAFEGTKIEKINLPGSIEYIGSLAFAYSNIEEIRIPENIDFINADTFERCKKLKKIYVPNNLDTYNLEKQLKENEIKCKKYKVKNDISTDI